MGGTAYYFHTAITSLLDIVLEIVIKHASQHLVTGISPSPSPTTASHDPVGPASMVPGRSRRRHVLNSIVLIAPQSTESSKQMIFLPMAPVVMTF
jgi:hypothetical protein